MAHNDFNDDYDFEKVKGKGRGVTFHTDREYILKNYGEEALKKVIAETKKMGYPIDYNAYNDTHWYPAKLRMVSLVAMRKALDMSSQDLKTMGELAPKRSLIVKLMLRYLVSIDSILKNAPKYWHKHWTVGNLELVERVGDEKAIFRIVDFEAPPEFCRYEEGYYLGILQMIGVFKETVCKEITCRNSGDEYHEFLLEYK